jgi:hypothetical protein
MSRMFRSRSIEDGNGPDRPPGLRLELNPTTLELRNVSVTSADGAFTQGFVMNSAPAPRPVSEWPLWRLNVSDCTVTLPQGTAVSACLGATWCGGRCVLAGGCFD